MKTKKTKKFKKMPENLSKEERNYVEVLLENIDSKFDIVVEGQEVLDKKIDKNHQGFQEFREEVNYKFETVFGELGRINSKLDKIELRLDNIEKEIRLMKNEIAELKSILSKKADIEKLENLEKRVLIMEKFLETKFAISK